MATPHRQPPRQSQTPIKFPPGNHKRRPTLRAITKSFFGVPANDRVDFDLRWGEIHALLGENGAGKSTLCSVLAGLYHPDSGEIHLDGERVDLASPQQALEHGVGMVYQHFRLVDRFTVAENLALGHPETGFVTSRRSLERQVAELGRRYGLEVSTKAAIWQLSVGEQQRVEILKLLYRGGSHPHPGRTDGGADPPGGSEPFLDDAGHGG